MEDGATSRTSHPRVSQNSSTPYDHDDFGMMCAHAAFVPLLVLERLALDPTAPGTAYQETFPAAVLFVDIAGYVRLSGATHRGVARRETRMDAQSRGFQKGHRRSRREEGHDEDDQPSENQSLSNSRVAGLAGEAMRDLVSDCFSSIVETVLRHGGDVVKFAGDALFAVWPVDVGGVDGGAEKEKNLSPKDKTTSLGEASLRAVQCGLKIQSLQTKRRFENQNKNENDLRLKVVIGAAVCCGVNVGGVDDRWEYLVTGDPVAQIARDVRFSKPDTVLVSKEMMELEEMQDHCVVEHCVRGSDSSVGDSMGRSRDSSGSSSSTDTATGDVDDTDGQKVLHRSKSGRSIFGLIELFGSIGGGAGWSLYDAPWPRGASRHDEKSTAFEVIGLTNGFDDEPVAFFYKPRCTKNRESILKSLIDRDKTLLEPMVKAVSRYTSSCVTFEDGNDMWRGEIRQCAIVFLDVHMMSCDDRNSFTLASAVAAMEVTQTVLKQTGGTLRQFLVDDKGSVVIVVFGLPAMAHSDDSTRAVTFALETIKNLKKKGLPNAKAGVCFGDVFCGAVGPPTRCEYAVYGDVVNTAARLMSHDMNENVLVCAATKNKCGNTVRFQKGTAVKLKGKNKVTKVFVPVVKNAGNACASIDSVSTKYVVMDTLAPRARRLAVLASALGEFFRFDVLLAASNGKDNAFNARDIEHLLNVGILRVVDEGLKCSKATIDSSPDLESDVSLSEVTISFDLSMLKGKKTDDHSCLLSFTDDAIHTAAVGMLTDAVRRPANAAAAMFLERKEKKDISTFNQVAMYWSNAGCQRDAARIYSSILADEKKKKNEFGVLKALANVAQARLAVFDDSLDVDDATEAIIASEECSVLSDELFSLGFRSLGYYNVFLKRDPHAAATLAKARKTVKRNERGKCGRCLFFWSWRPRKHKN